MLRERVCTCYEETERGCDFFLCCRSASLGLSGRGTRLFTIGGGADLRGLRGSGDVSADELDSGHRRGRSETVRLSVGRYSFPPVIRKSNLKSVTNGKNC